MKDSELLVSALRGMVSVAKSHKIDSVSLPTSLVGDIADQMETLLEIIGENDYASDKFEAYLLATKERVQLERKKQLNNTGRILRGG
ncbi:hypothetical protein [Priestia megaterium]|uniref:hypothetical protein n=1 Tax=Priestia megaterium TaxID=1404 RepID=UPI0032D97B2F